MKVQPTHAPLWSQLQRLGSAFDQLQASGATGPEALRQSGDITAPSAADRYGLVRGQLHVERATLQRADRITVVADDSLAQAWRMLQEADPDAVAELLAATAFEDTPLFNGRLTLHVGGGLTLPNLVDTDLQPEQVQSTRERINTFRFDTIAPRLSMVNEAITQSTHTESIAKQRAASAQTTAYLNAARTAGAAAGNIAAPRGGVLDITG